MPVGVALTLVTGLLLGGHVPPPWSISGHGGPTALSRGGPSPRRSEGPRGQPAQPEETQHGRPDPPRVWFTPGPGTLDMLRLFEMPDEWAEARARISVFKFYRSQLLDEPDPMVGPNTYDALRRVDALRTITRVWQKRIAIEVSAVKDFTCTDDMSGTDGEIRRALEAIRAVRAAGGEVAYLALDEPFTATVQSPRCGGRDLGPTLDRLERFFAGVRLGAPRVQIGLIEQFPTSSGAEVLDDVRLMIARGIRPAFFHLDADLNALPKGSGRFEREIPALADALEAEGVPFGVIFFGHDGDSDERYTKDALAYVRRAAKALPRLPRDIVFQSWARSKAGRWVTPRNLPEWAPDSHTALVDAGMGILLKPRGPAVPRGR